MPVTQDSSKPVDVVAQASMSPISDSAAVIKPAKATGMFTRLFAKRTRKITRNKAAPAAASAAAAPASATTQRSSNSTQASSSSADSVVPTPIDFAYLRQQTIGRDLFFPTPLGQMLLTYADYTASGRSLGFIEARLHEVLSIYANTHTEDSTTGRVMGHMLHQAEQMIKKSVNAGPNGRLVTTQSTGATGAINKLQQIIGVYVPPATRQKMQESTLAYFNGDAERAAAYERFVTDKSPVVFVGPYEHHSNEVSWRQGLCQVEEIDLAANGGVDLFHLARLLQDAKYAGRQRIVSISAASNVTGMITQVHQVARLAHTHGALCFFDFAASGPYVKIDMNPEGDPLGALDAVFLSPHKFLGGPGSCGALVFDQRIYNSSLAPTVGGGGTVEWVSANIADFNVDTEEREKSGTPGILQALRAGLAMELKDAVGLEAIHAREQAHLRRVFARWAEHGGVHVLGNNDPALRVGIVSFNVYDPRGRFLHFRLASVLLNDLFGIQSRAGCSCAGPYGHRLLQIDENKSERMLEQVRHGVKGIRPGWW